MLAAEGMLVGWLAGIGGEDGRSWGRRGNAVVEDARRWLGNAGKARQRSGDARKAQGCQGESGVCCGSELRLRLCSNGFPPPCFAPSTPAKG